MTRLILLIVTSLLLGSCWGYQDTDDYRQRKRLRDSDRMYYEVKRVRKKCSPNRGKPGRIHRKKYYS